MKFKSICLILLFTAFQTHATGFKDCFDHGNDGKEPVGAPRLYQIQKPTAAYPYPTLKAVEKTKSKKVFKLIVEDVRFSSYKCWDEDKNLTGHDVEMMTEAAKQVGFTHIEFILRTWNSAEIDGKNVPSLLLDLNQNLGDAVSAGMSMTEDREAVVHMVGPIYKAGKKLMARLDNPNITNEKLNRLLQTPENGYESLRGLSILVQASTIRSDFFHQMKALHPDLVQIASANEVQDKNKIYVFETDSKTIEQFTDSLMTTKVDGKLFDLVMIDTGSTQALIEEGKLGVETQIVSGNLSGDPKLGNVFGKGDGVSFRKQSPLIKPFAKALRSMAKSGRIDQLVQKWFKDENAADLSGI